MVAPKQKIEWTKFIPAVVTILALVAVFLVGKFAPEDLETVTDLVDELQPLLITAILAIVGKNTAVVISDAITYRADSAHVAELEAAKIYAQADKT